MLFPTVEFAIFFLVVFVAHWATYDFHRVNKWLLTGASYVFYSWWDWRFAILIFECSLVNWLLALWIHSRTDQRQRKAIMILAVAANLAVLAWFKYWGFFLTSLNDLLQMVGFQRDLRILEVLLPVGVSFFTFQGISYVVDVYKREIEPTRDPVDILLYNSFFPHLVAGPIVRAREFLPQIARPADPGAIQATRAILLIGLGLFKKVVIAHYLAVELVNPVFEAPGNHGLLDVLAGVYGYAVQIYCDFSAYSDMAIGIALLFGIEFPRNFDQPYRAASIREFWRRWHISLSNFLRDYLYIPQGGSRRGALVTYRSLLVTMLLGGLWHGAAWSFVVWGFLHGAAMCVERALGQRGIALPETGAGRVWRVVLTFHYVCLAWIFFNAESFSDAVNYLAAFGNLTVPGRLVTPFTLLLLAIGLFSQFLPPDLPQRVGARLARVPLGVQAAGFAVLVIVIAAVGPGALAPFIYFRF